MNATAAKPQAGENVISFFRASMTALAKVEQGRQLKNTLPDQIRHQRNLGWMHTSLAIVLMFACWGMVWYMAHASLTLGMKGKTPISMGELIVTIIAGGFSFGVTAFIFTQRQETKMWHWPAIIGYLAIIGVFVFNAVNALFPGMYLDLAKAIGATVKQASSLGGRAGTGVTSPWIAALWILKGVVALLATLGLMFAEMGTWAMKNAAISNFKKRAELAGVLADAKEVVERAISAVDENAKKVATANAKISTFDDDAHVINKAHFKADDKYASIIDALKQSIVPINHNQTDSTVDLTMKRNAEIQKRIAEIEQERGEIRDHLNNIIDITKARRATP